MSVQYDYQIQTFSGNMFDNLEAVGQRLQDALDSSDTAALIEQGWEVWQINNLSGEKIKGLIIVFRRPKA